MISTGTARRPKTPVLIANPTGTSAGPETPSFRNQCDESTPGAMNSTTVAAKGTRGNPSEAPRRGTSRSTAAALDNRTRASRDLTRWVTLGWSFVPEDGIRSGQGHFTDILQVLGTFVWTPGARIPALSPRVGTDYQEVPARSQVAVPHPSGDHYHAPRRNLRCYASLAAEGDRSEEHTS